MPGAACCRLQLRQYLSACASCAPMPFSTG